MANQLRRRNDRPIEEIGKRDTSSPAASLNEPKNTQACALCSAWPRHGPRSLGVQKFKRGERGLDDLLDGT